MTLETFVPFLVCVQTLIMLGGIPWAMSVCSRLAKLEVAIESIVPAADVARRRDIEALGAIMEDTRNKQADVRERLALVERDVQILREKQRGTGSG